MATWDDTKLIRMSSDPEDLLFPILNRVEAFKALLFVLALFPGFMAIQESEITTVDAQFAIDSLSLFSDDPGVETGLLPHAIAGTCLLLPQLSISQSMLLPICLCGFLLVISLYLFGKTVLNARCGFFAVILFLFHPLLIEQLSYPVIPILSTMLCLTGLWGYYRHLEQSSLFSPYILVSASAAGLNLLSLPIISLLMLVAILLETILFSILKRLLPSQTKNHRKGELLSSSLQFRLVSWSVLTAVVVSLGLLFLTLGTRYKIGLFEELDLFRQYFDDESPDWMAWIHALWEAGSFQVGVLFLGGLTAVKELRHNFLASSKNLVLGVLWVFFGCFWLGTLHSELFPQELIQTFKLMFLCCSMCMIAYGIDAIHQRKYSLKFVLLVMFLGLIIYFGLPDRIPSLPKSIVQWLTVLAIPFMFWQLLRYGSQQENYQRFILQCGLIVFLLFNVGVGWFFLQGRDYQTEAFDRFQAHTQEFEDFQTCLVLGPHFHDPFLRCLIEVNWLGTEVIYVEKWADAVKLLQVESARDHNQVLLVDSRQSAASLNESALKDWTMPESSEKFQFPSFSLQCHLLQK